MSKIDMKQAPYYDDYESSKQYTHLLAIPGRVAQAREITQIQSTMKDIIKSVGDSIMKNGDIVEGCQVIVKFSTSTESKTLTSNTDKTLLPNTVAKIISVYQNSTQYTVGDSSSTGACYLLVEDDKRYIKWNGTTNSPAANSTYSVEYNYNGTATVSPGRMYLDGIVLPVEEATVNITGIGEEIIGAKLVETIITEKEDSTLKDPAQGYDNYNQPGCHRVKSSVRIVKDDPDAVPIAKLLNGALYTEKYAPNYDSITQILARRTNDESGSYIVRGLNVSASNYSNSQFKVTIDEGKAYVIGYEVGIPSSRTLLVDKSQDTNSVSGIGFTFRESTQSYRLSNKPYAKEINSVKGYRSKTISSSPDTYTSGITFSELGVDIIVLKVYQGTTVFTAGTDYTVTRDGNQTKLTWTGTGTYPGSGANYHIDYQYGYTFTSSDYELVYNSSVDGYDISWKLSGNKPADNTRFIVDYTQYLARKDVIYLNQYGDIGYIKGNSAEYGFETLPTAPANTVILAYISSPPNGQVTSNTNLNISVENVGLTRFTMSDIQQIVNRIRTLEYDQAINALNAEARNYYDTNMTKRGIFTDPIIDLSKIDFTFNLGTTGTAVLSGLPVYDATMDLDTNTCYLPTITKTFDLSIDSNATSDSTRPKYYDKVMTLGVTGEAEVFSQMKATKSFLINPYSVFPEQPEVSITPSTDTWFEDTYIQVPISRTSNQVVSTSTRNVSNSQTLRGTFATYSVSSSTSKTTDTGITVDTSVSDSVLSEQTIRYIRSKTIEVSASKFSPNLDSIKCYFDGVQISMTPATGSTAGTATGSMKADANGSFKATFVIPENTIPTGIREVRFKTDDPGYASAFALYHASGTARTIQRTVETLTTILQTRVTTVTTTTYIDPVGQTFVLDRVTLLKGIDLYFEAKPTDASVTCEIREVSNGNITSTVLGSKELTPSQVNIHNKGNTATRFEFTHPVLLDGNTEYAFVVRSTSDKYRIWIAELGEEDVNTGSLVTSNPSLIGVMMSSSNNSSWTVHQTSDVKFRLIENTYSEQSEVVFNKLTRDFSRIILLSEFVNPEGTYINWFYSLDDGSYYHPIDPYNIQILNEVWSNVRLKATLSRDSDVNMSPMLFIEANSVILSSYDTSGCYITRKVAGLDSYTKITLLLDTYLPSGTTLKAYATTKNETSNTLTGRTDLIELVNTDNKPLNYGWTEQTFSVTLPTLPSGQHYTNCRLYIEMTSPASTGKTSTAKTPSFRRLRTIFS